MTIDSAMLLAIGQIVWINVLLSGDNAVVIALACRSLPDDKRRLGVALGAGAAVGLRVVFTVLIASLLHLPLLKIVGGVLLLWVSVKLLTDETEAGDIRDSTHLWAAVRTIALADMVMSLDNVLAIAAAANGSIALIVFGLLLSVPLIVFGASMVGALLEKFPALVWGGAALLGWVAGGLLASDPAWTRWLGWTEGEPLKRAAETAAALLVVAVAWAVRRARGAPREK